MAIYSGFSHEKWWFSIVMLVYQRVHKMKMFPCYYSQSGPNSHDIRVFVGYTQRFTDETIDLVIWTYQTCITKHHIVWFTMVWFIYQIWTIDFWFFGAFNHSTCWFWCTKNKLAKPRFFLKFRSAGDASLYLCCPALPHRTTRVGVREGEGLK